MKLTDFCMLSAALFVCLFLGRDLYIQGLLAQRISEVSCNRQIDRITEDALMDLVETEYEDGSLAVRTEQMQEQYGRLLALAFDLADDVSKLYAREAVALFCFRQYSGSPGMQETDQIIADLETQVNGIRRRRRQEQLFRIAMPYSAHEPWYQQPAGPQLLTVFDPRKTFWEYERAVLGGSRIVKQ